MNIFETPFWILGATLRDDRHRLMELAEEKSLHSDEDIISSASGVLTNPRKRLSAEMAWLPGLGPKRVAELVAQLQSDSNKVLHQENLPALARANLLVAGLKNVTGGIAKEDIAKWIVEIAAAFDEIDPKEALSLINEEREVSGFPAVTDHHALEAEIESRRHYYRTVVRVALNQLSPTELVGVITEIVESAAGMGDMPAPLLIDDLVEMYEVEAQDFLNKEEENIDDLLGRVRTAADEGASDSSLSRVVDELINVVKNWDFVAQPIQLSTKARGLGHEASTRVARKVRGVVIHLFNKHDKLDLSQKMTSMLQEVFAEVVDVADRTEEDAFTLEDIAEQRQLGTLLDPISDLCAKALKHIEDRPSSAHSEAQNVVSTASRLLSDLRYSGAPENLLNHGRDEIALTLMQCAVVYGNETSKWKECVEILEDAKKHAGSQEARKRILKNLQVANENKGLYSGLSPISSAPELSTTNGFGFTLYGSTDYDPLSRSHIATYYFTALYIPVFPIARYRVIQNGSSYRFLGKAQLRPADKIHIAISIGLTIAVLLAAQ